VVLGGFGVIPSVRSFRRLAWDRSSSKIRSSLKIKSSLKIRSSSNRMFDKAGDFLGEMTSGSGRIGAKPGVRKWGWGSTVGKVT
jgi:hypothetical protein